MSLDSDSEATDSERHSGWIEDVSNQMERLEDLLTKVKGADSHREPATKSSVSFNPSTFP